MPAKPAINDVEKTQHPPFGISLIVEYRHLGLEGAGKGMLIFVGNVPMRAARQHLGAFIFEMGAGIC